MIRKFTTSINVDGSSSGIIKIPLPRGAKVSSLQVVLGTGTGSFNCKILGYGGSFDEMDEVQSYFAADGTDTLINGDPLFIPEPGAFLKITNSGTADLFTFIMVYEDQGVGL